jgi:hypothetical protein
VRVARTARFCSPEGRIPALVSPGKTAKIPYRPQQYNRARYYDPVTARWMSQDPLGFDAGDSNLYRYVQNEPANATDPTGLKGELTWQTLKEAVKARGLPTTMIEELEKLNNTNFVRQPSIKLARWIGGNAGEKNTIELAPEHYDRLAKGAANNEGMIGIVFNELFSDYFHQVIEKNPAGKWALELIKIGAKLAYRGPLIKRMGPGEFATTRWKWFEEKEVELTEEAMSEMMEDMVDAFQRGAGPPAMRKDGFGAAKHNTNNQAYDTWYYRPIAALTVSPYLVGLTTWILYNGIKDPSPGTALDTDGLMKRVVVIAHFCAGPASPLAAKFANNGWTVKKLCELTFHKEA